MFRRAARRLRTGRIRALKSPQAYALWAPSYIPQAHNPLMQAEEGAVRDLLPALAGQVVLDAGCGTGRYARMAQAAGARRVLGVDNSLPMLLAGQRSAPQTAKFPVFALGSLDALPVKTASIDALICGLAVGHAPDLAAVLSEIGRVLRPEGIAIVSDFHPFLALSGSQRTFTLPGGAVYAVEHYPHLYSDFHTAARSSGLSIDAVREPGLKIDGLWKPAAIVYRMRKEPQS